MRLEGKTLPSLRKTLSAPARGVPAGTPLLGVVGRARLTPAQATPADIVDTAPGAIVVDGVIDSGAYAGSTPTPRPII